VNRALLVIDVQESFRQRPLWQAISNRSSRCRPLMPLPLSELAAVAGCSERTLTRSFARATGLTPLRYQQALRLERAERLLDRGATVVSAAHAVGFADARMLRRLRAR
jgi:transcriptional regulator GlxA family with amidase domain